MTDCHIFSCKSEGEFEHISIIWLTLVAFHLGTGNKRETSHGKPNRCFTNTSICCSTPWYCTACCTTSSTTSSTKASISGSTGWLRRRSLCNSTTTGLEHSLPLFLTVKFSQLQTLCFFLCYGWKFSIVSRKLLSLTMIKV